MGRKIPGKKHRGTKDPAEQQRVREESIKNKINSPPGNVNEQPVPGSLQKIAEWKELDNTSLSRKQFKKRDIFKSWLLGKVETVQLAKHHAVQRASGSSKSKWKTDKKVPNRVSQKLVSEYMKSHSDSYESNSTSKKKKGDVDQIILNSGGKVKKGKKKVDGELRVSKKERMKLHIAAKKQARMEKIQECQDEKLNLVDAVKFGEVVHAPPVLSLPLKNKVKSSDSKPGQRVLLLKQLLPTTNHACSFKLRNSQGKGKKAKNVSVKERGRLEHNRLQVVQDYRKLKAMKRLHES